MGGAGEGADHPAFAEHRRHHREVVQMAAGEPRVVGDVDIALAHDLVGVAGEEVLHRNGHRVDVAGRAGDRLGEHPALGVEDAGGEVARLAHGGAEGGAQKRLRLLLHHRDQAVPHDLRLDLCEPGVGRAVHQASSPLCRPAFHHDRSQQIDRSGEGRAHHCRGVSLDDKRRPVYTGAGGEIRAAVERRFDHAAAPRIEHGPHPSRRGGSRWSRRVD